jgi:hypothetical protein
MFDYLSAGNIVFKITGSLLAARENITGFYYDQIMLIIQQFP